VLFRSIILSTHILEEVEAICTRVVIIARGKVKEDSTAQALCKREGGTLDEVFRKLTQGKRQAVKGGVA
jgi:ABC-2 type transport system ATP-binding protein